MTDGRRDCIRRTIPSALANLNGPITDRVIHDDSGDPAYRAWLAAEFPTFTLIGPPNGRSGFGGAIASAWSWLLDGTSAHYVFHLEDDFTFNRPVEVIDMAEVLDNNPHVAQVALRRQPWNDREKAAGGVVEADPAAYRDVHQGGFDWLEHRLFFTTNPSLYRSRLCKRGWPIGERSEGFFAADLFRDPAITCAYWGARESGEWVHHIGERRIGVGY